MTMLVALLNVVTTLAMSVVVVGVINRVKARWSGRVGPPILQLAFDIVRLFRKGSVYSSTTTAVFRVAPWIVLLTAVASATIVPALGTGAPVSFAFDFVAFAYLWGLGRVALMLGALDTGSSFEGMGASREATYASLLEPTLFLVMGALCASTGHRTLAGALALHLDGGGAVVIQLASIVALTIAVQVESARVPVDDPSTHLELTMIHEVMVLDHSGPDLAAVQLAAGIKLAVGVSVIATLLNPLVGSIASASDDGPALALAGGVNVLLSLGVAAVLGSVESLVARLKLRAVPQYILVGMIAGAVALLATTWSAGGAP